MWYLPFYQSLDSCTCAGNKMRLSSYRSYWDCSVEASFSSVLLSGSLSCGPRGGWATHFPTSVVCSSVLLIARTVMLGFVWLVLFLLYLVLNIRSIYTRCTMSISTNEHACRSLWKAEDICYRDGTYFNSWHLNFLKGWNQILMS